MLAIGWQARQRSRQFLLDETVLRKQQDLTRLVSLNWLTPDMDGLVAGSVQERRRFLDRIIFSLDPSHSRRIRELGLVVRQRHSLLREGRTDETQLSIYESQISAYGLETLLVRAWTVSGSQRALLGRARRFVSASTASHRGTRARLCGGRTRGRRGRTRGRIRGRTRGRRGHVGRVFKRRSGRFCRFRLKPSVFFRAATYAVLRGRRSSARLLYSSGLYWRKNFETNVG